VSVHSRRHAVVRHKISYRIYYSLQHLLSSVLFARRAYALEQDTKSDSANLFTEHRAYVTGSIITAIAFLEATINELFADAGDESVNRMKQLSPQLRQLMAQMWALRVPRTASYAIVDKYQIALTLAGAETFPPGQKPFQDIGVLVELRNELIHYEPTWRDERSPAEPNEASSDKLGRKLRAILLSNLNPLAGAERPYFPDHCLGYGCAKWSVTESVRFVDGFFGRIGMSSSLDEVRRDLALPGVRP
jgi:hypothetical protein